VLQPVRGTHDILPEEMRAHRHVSDTARRIAECYGFDEMATPIFEFSNVFARTLGEASDIVAKEMYSFVDQGGDEITLRPENTAGVARCFISRGLVQQTPVKFFCSGPMFRHERPQKGRLRQFHQIDVEYIGVAGPQADIEVIAVGDRILEALGVREHTVLELNTLGEEESRARYRKELVTYFNDYVSDLSEDSRRRLERNPLRILDSKDSGDRRIVADAPDFQEFLNANSADFFAQVKAGLDLLSIKYEINPRLVRGLDYYCHTAFEFTTTQLGAQGAVLAGGRYDGLIEALSGPSTPGVGWAAGIERLAMLTYGVPERRRPIAIIPIGANAEAPALKLSEELRQAGFRVDLGDGGNLKKRMRRANKVNAVAAILMGEDELAKNVVTVRDMDSGDQESTVAGSIVAQLTRFR
jgi:histidyl-tRNA synthetase